MDQQTIQLKDIIAEWLVNNNLADRWHITYQAKTPPNSFNSSSLSYLVGPNCALTIFDDYVLHMNSGTIAWASEPNFFTYLLLLMVDPPSTKSLNEVYDIIRMAFGIKT